MLRINPLRRRDRRRQQRGAVAVEAALITPVLIVLIFGMIDFGLLFKDYLAVTSASRAGVRIASAEPHQTGFAQDAADQVAREGRALESSNIEEVWVYKSQANGYPIGSSSTAVTGCSVCVKFHPDANGNLIAYSTTWTANQQNACAGTGTRDTVGVYVEYDHPATIGLFFDTFTLKDHTVMALEPLTAASGCGPS